MDFTILGTLLYLKGIVILTGSQIKMRLRPQVDIGYVFTIGGAAVSWRSCKQTILTKSTMEAELIAFESATTEAEWLKELLMDLPMVAKPVPGILLHCDNQSMITIVGNAKKIAKFARHVKR
jgi:hypothetical protein